MRYIPKERLSFDYISAEGPLHLFYQSNDSFFKRVNNWKISAAISAPATAMAYYTLGSQFWWVYPMLQIPTIHYFIDYLKLKMIFKTEAYKIWLLKNGEQFIM